jgi:hypothetical protein
MSWFVHRGSHVVARALSFVLGRSAGNAMDGHVSEPISHDSINIDRDITTTTDDARTTTDDPESGAAIL